MSGVLVTDPQLRIVRVNKAFCALSGFDTAELVGGRPPYPFWTELQADRARQQMRETTEEDGDFQLTVRRRDGRFIDAAVSVTAVRGSDGELIAYVATYEDLSAARAQAQLERALRDVAAAAAAATNDPQAVFDQVAARLAELVSAPSATIVRFEGDSGVIVGVHAHPSVARSR
jgi:PAS domain S-box-containing protein